MVFFLLLLFLALNSQNEWRKNLWWFFFSSLFFLNCKKKQIFSSHTLIFYLQLKKLIGKKITVENIDCIKCDSYDDTNGTTDHLNLSYVTVFIWRVKSIKNIQQIHRTQTQTQTQPTQYTKKHTHTLSGTHHHMFACCNHQSMYGYAADRKEKNILYALSVHVYTVYIHVWVVILHQYKVDFFYRKMGGKVRKCEQESKLWQIKI